MASGDDYTALRDAMFLQAALVDAFRPRDLMAEVVPAEQRSNILLRGQLMSALREQCTTLGDYWQLRPIARRKILSDATQNDALPEGEITTALKGEHQYTDDALQSLIEGDAPLERLSLAVSTLERAGPSAPGHGKLLALSSKLDRRRGETATDAVLAGGFVGRQDELDALLQALDTPYRQAPLRNLHIQGMPGVGKTFLLEQLSKLCRDRPRIVLVRLDFDRAALSSGAVEAVFDEISRQIGAALPEHAAELHRLRLASAARRTRIATKATDPVPRDLLKYMVDVLAQTERQLVFLLDTLEVLHGYGVTFVQRLMRQVDRFADDQLIDITVISAGRGLIFAPDDARLAQFIKLEKLDRDVTRALLVKRDIPAELHDQIIDLSRGNPLRLTLVTRALTGQGGDATLDVDEVRSADNGYLYRAILSRVPVAIRQIAAEGLILPALGITELTEIIGPALGQRFDIAEATTLLDTLEQQAWMVVRSKVDDKLRQHDHVRREMLELTYAERPGETRLINAAAVAYYDRRDPLMRLYHRLQLTRAGGDMPGVDPILARGLTENLLADLPGAAQDAVLRAQGARSRVAQSAGAAPERLDLTLTTLRQKHVPVHTDDVLCICAPQGSADGRLQLVKGTGTGAAADLGGLNDLRNMLEDQHQAEATFLIKELFAKPVRFEGDAARLALTHQWHTGHWSMARSLLGLLPDDALADAVENDLHLTGLALLESWAEFRFARLCSMLSDDAFAGDVRVALNLTQRLGLRGGALAMAMLSATGGTFLIEDTGINMLHRYLPADLIRFDNTTAERSTAIRGEFGLRYEAEASLTADQFGLLAAPLNPYIAPLRALLDDLSASPDRKVLRDLAALHGSVARLAPLYAPGMTGTAAALEFTRPNARDVVELLASIGLTAEWSGGYSTFSPIPDLPTIARAAMRWQAASLGRWSYDGAAPAEWEASAVDPLALARAHTILETSDPRGTALQLLTLWDDPAAPSPDPLTVPKKLRRTYTALIGTASPEAGITHLQGTTVPSALWPPLAALAHLGLTGDDIF